MEIGGWSIYRRSIYRFINRYTMYDRFYRRSIYRFSIAMKRFWFLSLAILLLLGGWFLSLVFSGTLILSPVAFSLFGWPVHWYGVWVVGAFLLSYFLLRHWQGGDLLIELRRLPDLLLGVFFFGIVFARLTFVFLHFSLFRHDLWSVLRFWEGGLTFYGGILGGVLFILVVARSWRVNFWRLGNLTALILPLAQSVGRLGNLFNYEAYGLPTSLPWKMFVPPSFRLESFAREAFYHPLFLYEIIANLLIFSFLYFFRFKVTQINLFGLYLILYSFFRFLLEFIRLDTLYWGALTFGQWGSLAVMIVGIMVTILWQSKAK